MFTSFGTSNVAPDVVDAYMKYIGQKNDIKNYCRGKLTECEYSMIMRLGKEFLRNT